MQVRRSTEYPHHEYKIVLNESRMKVIDDDLDRYLNHVIIFESDNIYGPLTIGNTIKTVELTIKSDLSLIIQLTWSDRAVEILYCYYTSPHEWNVIYEPISRIDGYTIIGLDTGR